MINLDFIVSCVPKNRVSLNKSKYFKKSEVEKLINYTGFKNINRLSKHIDTNTFLFKSIKQFFKVSKTDINRIDAIIFSSHSRENEMPIFASQIQKKFNLKNEILCFDLPNSCTGFTNGLIHSYSLIKSGVIKNKILLICADTHSKLVDKNNKNLLPVVGDGCSCVLISKKKENNFYYNFGTDGDHALNISNFKGRKKLNMDGIKVFEFALKRVVKSILNLTKSNKFYFNKIDYISLHQPNITILNHLIKKIGIEKKKIISCFDYGNTSSPSIPISICSKLANKNIKNKSFLFSGFGSGFLWSSIIMTRINCKVSKIFKI